MTYFAAVRPTPAGRFISVLAVAPMLLCLFEDARVAHFMPMASTRAIYDLRIGMDTLADRLHHVFRPSQIFFHARREVMGVTALEHRMTQLAVPPARPNVLYLNGRIIQVPNSVRTMFSAALKSQSPRVFLQGDTVVAAILPEGRFLRSGIPASEADFEGIPQEQVEGVLFVERLWDFIRLLRPVLETDFTRKTGGVVPDARFSVHTRALIVHPERVYLAPGAVVRPGAVVSGEQGPVFLDARSEVLEGAVVRGPFYLGPNSRVNSTSVIEGSAIGPGCKVGGEVFDSIVHSFTNKAHQGFLGHSYLGRWCNIGADTNTSNLRNDYGQVSLFDEATGQFEATGMQFLGTFLADHAKCSIDSTFNTGSVIGVASNVYGYGFHDRHIPNFSWGEPGKYVPYRIDKALDVARAVMARRQRHLTEEDELLLRHLALEAHRG